MTLHESEKLLKSQSARGCCSCLQSSPFSPAIDLMMHYLSLHTGLFLLRKNKLPPGPGLASQRKYCKHLSHRQNNIQGKGSHKKLQAVWSGAIPRNSDKRKTVRQMKMSRRWREQRLSSPHQTTKPWGIQAQVVMDLKLALPCSVPICHIPPFMSINYHKNVAAC